MSDWADFCENEGIDPNEPDQFDDWLAKLDAPRPSGRRGLELALELRELLNGLADPLCGRCRGTGYLGRYSWHCGGRCFACLPDARWFAELQELKRSSSNVLTGRF